MYCFSENTVDKNKNRKTDTMKKYAPHFLRVDHGCGAHTRRIPTAVSQLLQCSHRCSSDHSISKWKSTQNVYRLSHAFLFELLMPGKVSGINLSCRSRIIMLEIVPKSIWIPTAVSQLPQCNCRCSSDHSISEWKSTQKYIEILIPDQTNKRFRG